MRGMLPLRIVVSGFLSIVACLACVVRVQASNAPPWYAGAVNSNTTGGQTQIWTPQAPIYRPQGGQQSSWVSLSPPYWIQAGIIYPYLAGDATPRMYFEWCLLGCHQDGSLYQLQATGWAYWGSFTWHEIYWTSAYSWCAGSTGYYSICQDNIQSIPTDMQFQSEIHDNSSQSLEMSFQEVQIRTTSYSWQYANLTPSHLSFQPPYLAFQTSVSSFRTMRGKQAYVPDTRKP